MLNEMQFLRQRFEETDGVDFEEAAIELEKFFILTTVTDQPLAMINKNFDKLWHRFIEFTEVYEKYCRSRYGFMIHHRSRTMTTPIGDAAVRNFYAAYEAHFGAVPSIWEKYAPAELTDFGRGRSTAIPARIAWSGWPGRSPIPNILSSV